MSLHGQTIRQLEQRFDVAHERHHQLDGMPPGSDEAVQVRMDTDYEVATSWRVLRWLRHEGHMRNYYASTIIDDDWRGA